MDSIRVSEAPDSGSIPDEATNSLSGVREKVPDEATQKPERISWSNVRHLQNYIIG